MVDKKYHPLTIWDIGVQEELSSPPPTSTSPKSPPFPNPSSSIDQSGASRPSTNNAEGHTASQSPHSEHNGLADLFVGSTSDSESGGEIRDRRGSGVYKRVGCLKDLCCKDGEGECCAGERK